MTSREMTPDELAARIEKLPAWARKHIPEICSRTRNAGKKQRKNPNLPEPQWPGIIS